MRWFPALTLFLFIACNESPTKENSQDPVLMLADLHCEAVSLRKARFALADEIRFSEDTLLHLDADDSTRFRLELKLKSITPYKDSIVTRSLDLSKIIKAKLDSLIEIEFKDAKQRAAFDAALAAELSKRGCE